MALGRQAEQHVDVAQAEIRVENPDAITEACHRDSQVHDHVGLAYAALAARDREYGSEFRLHWSRRHAIAPSRAFSPITNAASIGGVARCRSSGTFWPVPKYETGSPRSRMRLTSGPSDSTSSSLVRTSREGRASSKRSNVRRAAATGVPAESTRCVRTPDRPASTRNSCRQISS